MQNKASLFVLLAIAMLTLFSCKKEKEKNETGQIDGIWTVDSVINASYENGVPGFTINSINKPHFLNFNYADHVIQNLFGKVDTAAFIQLSYTQAQTDLDFNGTTDIATIFRASNGDLSKLEWLISKDSIGSTEYKSIATMYLSK